MSPDCNLTNGVLVRYDLIIKSSLSTIRESTKNGEFSLQSNFIQPYEDYEYQVAFVNSAGIGPYTPKSIIKTKQAAPTPPTALRIESLTNISATISWSNPVQINGILKSFKVTWTKANGASLSKSVGDATTITNITELTPFTDYVVSIQAETEPGFGESSSDLKLKTSQGIPSAPRNLLLNFRNETCLTISWSKPNDLPGIFKDYYIEISILYSYSTLERFTRVHTTNKDVFDLCDLNYATQYRVSIAASTDAGYGPKLSNDFWTEISEPPSPASPVFQDATNSTIRVQLLPTVITTGPISNYYLVVQGERYAGLKSSFLQVPTFFTIGDNKFYQEYRNIGKFFNLHFNADNFFTLL